MSVTLADAQDRILCEDGRTWKAVRVVSGEAGPQNRTKPARRETLAEGAFDEPLPLLEGGTTRIGVSADAADGARVTLVKTYLR